jgi:hypothetical protein
LVRRIDDYSEIDNFNAAGRARGAWKDVRNPIKVVSWEGRAAFVDGAGMRMLRHLDVMGPRECARPIVVGSDRAPA